MRIYSVYYCLILKQIGQYSNQLKTYSIYQQGYQHTYPQIVDEIFTIFLNRKSWLSSRKVLHSHWCFISEPSP